MYKKISGVRAFMIPVLFCSPLFMMAQNPRTNASKIQQPAKAVSSPSNPAVKPLTDTSGARNETTGAAMLDVNLLLAFPMAEFDKKMNAVGFGFNAGLLFGLYGKQTGTMMLRPYAGLAFDYIYFDGARRTISNPNNNMVPGAPTSYESNVNSNCYALYPVFHLELAGDVMAVFAEAFYGGRLFDAHHKLTYQDYSNHTQTVSSSSLSSDISYFTGFGGGVKFGSPMIKGVLKMLYSEGGQTKFIDVSSIKFDSNGGVSEYSTLRSRSDMMVYYLGVNVTF
jgi:hypothetical protein